MKTNFLQAAWEVTMKKLSFLSISIASLSLLLFSCTSVDRAQRNITPYIALIVESKPSPENLQMNNQMKVDRSQDEVMKRGDMGENIQETALTPEGEENNNEETALKQEADSSPDEVVKVDDVEENNEETVLRQERDLRQAFADSEAASVTREGNLLAISLKGDLTFDVNSTTVRQGLYSEIDNIADAMLKYSDTLARVEGYTDSTGSEHYNLDLSIKRAEMVKYLMIQRGVESSRIKTMGFGESRPIASNDTEAGRMLNRRVEIKILPSNN